MDSSISSQLEQKVQILINNYKELKEQNEALSKQVRELTTIKDNNTLTINELQKTIEQLESSLAAKTEEYIELEKQSNEYLEKLSNYENITKTTTSQIDSILSQLSRL